MAEQQYDLFYSGQLLDGHFLDFVKADLQKLIKADEAYVDRLFSGTEQPVKKKVDKPTAIKFQQAFKKVGAKLIVRAHNPNYVAPAASQASEPKKAPANSNAQPTPSQVASTKPDVPQTAIPSTAARASTPSTGVNSTHFETTDQVIAGENEDHLIEHHQPDIKAPETLPTWDISAPGAILTKEKEFIPANINTDTLSVAELGSESVSHLGFEEPVPVINTDQISLAENGGYIENLDTAPAPVNVDTSHLSVE
jgi:hypothetical protein